VTAQPDVALTPTLSKTEIHLRGIILREFEQGPGLRIPFHWHSNAILSFTLTGSATERFRSREFDLTNSTILFKPPEEVHAHAYGRIGSKVLAIEIAPTRLLEFGLRGLSQLASVRSLHVQSLFAALRREIPRQDAGTALVLEGIILEILGNLERAAHRPACERTIELLTDFLHENHREKLTLHQLSRIFQTPAEQLCMAFRRQHACTIGEYQRELRLQYALTKLQLTDCSLIDIAFESGFFDQSHFSRAVKSRTGLTPREVRTSVAHDGGLTKPRIFTRLRSGARPRILS
jgi:AraC family transcriptional regulator